MTRTIEEQLRILRRTRQAVYLVVLLGLIAVILSAILLVGNLGACGRKAASEETATSTTSVVPAV